VLELTNQPFLPASQSHTWTTSLTRFQTWLATLSANQKIFSLAYLVSLLSSLVIWLWLGQQISDSADASSFQSELITQIASNSANPASISSAIDCKTTSSLSGRIAVHLAGAIKKPGIYNLSQDSLVADAVQAAGGLSSNVWQDYIDETINLAQPLLPNQKVWIPSLNQKNLIIHPSDTSQEVMVESQTSTNSESDYGNNLAPISINQASKAELMSLAGIGEKRAEDIMANRPYLALDELVTKAKIPAATYADFKSQLQL
jgi:competence protein ComEA